MSEKRYRLRVPARDQVVEGIVRRVVNGQAVVEFVPLHFRGDQSLGIPDYMDIAHAVLDHTLVEVRAAVVAAVAAVPAAVTAAVAPVAAAAVAVIAEVPAIVAAVAEAAPAIEAAAAAVASAADAVQDPIPAARAVRVGRRGGRS